MGCVEDLDMSKVLAIKLCTGEIPNRRKRHHMASKKMEKKKKIEGNDKNPA